MKIKTGKWHKNQFHLNGTLGKDALLIMDTDDIGLITEVVEQYSAVQLFHKRMFETAIPTWQKEKNKPGVHPDLGELVRWLIEKA